MRRVSTLLIRALWLSASAALLHAQSPATESAQISKQQIAAVLKQALSGAPQETGGGLFDGDHYRIGALKRQLPGEVEVHRRDTDIMYVLSGSATLLTGGTVYGLHDISAAEQRGKAIRGGVQHLLVAGDMLVIPKNQPHWFQAVQGEVSYIVIKVQ